MALRTSHLRAAGHNLCVVEHLLRHVNPMRSHGLGGAGLPRCHRYAPPSARCAFTLIELLVVIAIISLLVSILLPSLTKAKELAKAVVCMNNEKSIGLAIQYYAEDYDDLFVPASKPKDYNNLSGDWFEAHTTLYELDYLRDTNVWTCPSASVDWWAASSYYGAGTRGLGYAVNYWHVHNQNMAWPPDPLRRSDLERGSEVISFMDSCTQDSVGHPWGSPYYAFCPWCSGSDVTRATLTDRHNGNDNVLFADGHVEPVAFDDILDNVNDIWGHDSR